MSWVISECERIAGFPVLIVESDRMQLKMILGRGGELIQLFDKLYNIEYLHVNATEMSRMEMDYASKRMGSTADYFIAGLYCMFPNAGEAFQYEGAEYAFHGDIRHVPWEFHIQTEPKDIVITFAAKSASTPYRIQRTLKLQHNEPCRLDFRDELILDGQLSTVPMPYLYGIHPYDADLLPFVWYWVQFIPKDKTYISALIPSSTGQRYGLKGALNDGSARWLQPGAQENVEWSLIFTEDVNATI